MCDVKKNPFPPPSLMIPDEKRAGIQFLEEEEREGNLNEM